MDRDWAAIAGISDDADDLARRFSKGRAGAGAFCNRSRSGSPFGQYCLAMASLMIITPGAEASS